MNTDVLPIVSVACITYNHEPYIRQCLDGFVMQKTNFPFEIVIHDDASTDNTKVIIQEYCQKYPHLFRPIFQDINRFKEGKGILARFVFPECRGKYIALCEGDDYWTDPLKLQKQVDFLEDNKEYSMCFTNAFQQFGDRYDVKQPFADITNKEYSGRELFRNWLVPTASVMLRREVILSKLYKDASANSNFVFGDILIILTSASLGKVKALSCFTSVYRRLPNGTLARQNKTDERQLAYINHIIEIPKVFGDIYKEDSDRIVVLQYYALAKKAICNKEPFKMLKYLVLSCDFSLIRTLQLYFRKIKRWFSKSFQIYLN